MKVMRPFYIPACAVCVTTKTVECHRTELNGEIPSVWIELAQAHDSNYSAFVHYWLRKYRVIFLYIFEFRQLALRSEVRLLRRARDFSLLLNVQTGCVARFASCSVRTADYSPWGKADGAWGLQQFIIELKNKWSLTSSHRAYLNGVYRDKFESGLRTHCAFFCMRFI
jgi:hypothetical protein